MLQIRLLLPVFVVGILLQFAHGKPKRGRLSSIVNPDDKALSISEAGHRAQYNKGRTEGDMLIAPRFNGQFRNVLNDKYSKWPNKTVPYEFAPGFNAAAKAVVEAAIADYHKYSCLRFVPRTNERDYVQYIVDDGCYSYVGRSIGRQPISIGRGCEYKGIAIHEMLHTVGFFHEQSRTNRDDYITIDFKNIDSTMYRQFEKISKDQEITYGTEYDYHSVMHYSPKSFSNNGKDTITPKDPNARIGQRQGFSETDLIKLNKHYDCVDYLNKPKESGSGAKPNEEKKEEKKEEEKKEEKEEEKKEEKKEEKPPVHPVAKKKCLVEHWSCKNFAAECNKNTKTGRYIYSVCLQTCNVCVDKE